MRKQKEKHVLSGIRLALLWESLRSAYWFIPGLLLAFGGLLALILVGMDRQLEDEAIQGIWWVFSGGAEGARTVLSTVAGSVITVAGTTFSITIAVLTLTSSQFGPRLLRGFLRDTGNQVVLGTFLATFLYCLLTLRTVRSVEEQYFVPHLAVTVGVALAIASVCVLIYFIHHVSQSIQVSRIVAGVTDELMAAITRLFPDEIGASADAIRETTDEDFSLPEDVCVIRAWSTGYVQAVDGESVFSLAKQSNLVIDLLRAPGEFVVAGTTLARVSPPPEKADEAEDIAQRLNATVVLGDQRTANEDAEFLVLQLVEVAVRALSPGINDPFTAVLCLDNLGAALCHLAGRSLPSPLRVDENGVVRVVARPVSFARILTTAFREIIRYGSADPMVAARLLKIVADIGNCARTESQRLALRDQAALVREAVLSATSQDAKWQSEIQEQYRVTLSALSVGAHLSDREAGKCN